MTESSKQSATRGESPDEWYEREKTAFRAWWESEGEKTFSRTPTLAAGAGWFARAEAAPETAPIVPCLATNGCATPEWCARNGDACRVKTPVSETRQIISKEDSLLASSWAAEEEIKEACTPEAYSHNSAIKFARIVERVAESVPSATRESELPPAECYVLAIHQSIGSILSPYAAKKIMDRAKEIENGH